MRRQGEEVLEYAQRFSFAQRTQRTDRKSELVARAFGPSKLSAPIKFSYDQIYQQIEEEYSRRLISNGIKSDLITATQINTNTDKLEEYFK